MGKIIITGPGRAGTSFLVRLLTHLGEDTGWTTEEDGYQEGWRAGCEQRIIISFLKEDATPEKLAAAPRILKSPDWSFFLKPVVAKGWMEVDHVFIPYRDLETTARSRVDVGLHWMCDFMEDACYEDLVGHQANIHGLALGKAMDAVWSCNLPHTVMMFPRLVKDAEYCYNMLSRGIKLDREEFDAAFATLARPEQIKWHPEAYRAE